MAHGGARPGAGRKPGSTDKIARGAPRPAYPEADTPLAYLLSVMRDPAVDPRRRDDAARAALPYVHPKAVPQVADRGAAAANATPPDGSSWHAVLHPARVN